MSLDAFQQQEAIFFNSVYETARDAITSMLRNVAHFQSTVQEYLDWQAAQAVCKIFLVVLKVVLPWYQWIRTPGLKIE